MKKIIITCGLIAGLIVTSWMVVVMTGIAKAVELSNWGLVIGYGTMLVAFSLIFVAVKSYLDKQNNGVISFGNALGMGLLITLIASTIYVAVWFIYYRFFAPDFYQKYIDGAVKQLQASGASQAKINEVKAQGQLYNNPLMVILMTYVEILPMGIIMSVLAALILKRKTPATGAVASPQAV